MTRKHEVENFEDFMYNYFCDNYRGLDDDLIDAYDDWLCLMDESIKDRYIDLFGKVMFTNGYKEAMSDTARIMERIGTK